MKSTYNFRYDVLKTLMKNNNMTSRDLSTVTGVSVPSILKYLSGKNNPTVPVLIAFSNALNVPIELFTGQMDEMIKDRDAYLKMCATDLRALNFKLFTNDKYYFKKVRYANTGYELPYPLNLYNDMHILDDNKIELPISTDQMNGLEKAILDSLNNKEKSCIIQYYKDELSLAEISEQYGVSRERVRQIIAKGIRKLKNPNAKKLILFGIRGSGLLKREMELDDLEKTLEKREQIIADHASLINTKLKIVAPELQQEENLKKIELEDLGISTRAYTCLRRSNIRNLYDLSKMTLKELFAIRNMGKHTVDEIIAAMRRYDITPKEETNEKS